jgi:hypothetical protein
MSSRRPFSCVADSCIPLAFLAKATSDALLMSDEFQAKSESCVLTTGKDGD